MKKTIVTLICSLLLGSMLPFNMTAGASNVIDDFSQYPAGKFPSSWRTWPFQRGKAKQVYSVQEENGKKFLHAYDDKDLSIQILRNLDWKIENYPNLSWQWRARTLPKGANETSSETNDSACGVYVVLSKFRQMMLKYTWSTTAPAGTVYEKVPGKAYIIVLDSGDAQLGKWRSHTIDVKADYKKYFKEDIDRSPAAIAILTDGNATHSAAQCDYADFTISEGSK